MADASDVAAYMLMRLKETGYLYQEVIVYEIQEKFGDEYIYFNQNGNIAIGRDVLQAFRNLTENDVVWMRGERCWRFKQDYDPEGTRMVE